MNTIKGYLDEFDRFREVLQETAGCHEDRELYMLLMRGTAGGGCPVCDGFKGTTSVHYLWEPDQALTMLSDNLNDRHAVDLVVLTICNAEVTDSRQVKVLYDRTSRHSYGGIRVPDLGKEYHDLGNGTKGWTETT